MVPLKVSLKFIILYFGIITAVCATRGGLFNHFSIVYCKSNEWFMCETIIWALYHKIDSQICITYT